MNYRNPEVVEALHKTMRFWLDKGVDGFRVDVIWLMMKDPLFRDEPPNPNWDGVNRFDSLLHVHTANLPEVHDLVRGMRKVLDEYDDRMMVGEIYLPNAELVKYYGTPEQRECHLPFNFQLINTKWNAASVRKAVDEYEAALPADASPNWVMGNHDQHRLATRVGAEQARVAAMLLLTLRGTPTCYYGDELGMENVPIPPEMVQDPPAVNQPEIAHIYGRDPERTPMQWDASPHAGFSHPDSKSPWLPLAANYEEVNVTSQLENTHSMLNFYRRLLELRKNSSALQIGDYRSLEINSAEVFAYERKSTDQRLIIALNFSSQAQTLSLPKAGSKVILSTSLEREGEVRLAEFVLNPNEGCVIAIQ